MSLPKASNLSTLSRCINIFIDVGLHWLPKWQDRCYRASRELCSNYLHWKLRPNRCRWKHSYYWQPIGSRHPILPSPTPLSLTHNTAHLAYHSALWFSKVIQSQWFTCYLQANMHFPISDQWQPKPYLSPFLRYGWFFIKFSTPSPFNPQFENVFLAVDCWNFACSSFIHMANYSFKSFPQRLKA